MAKFSLGRPDDRHAKLSLYLALASVMALMMQLFVILQNADLTELVVRYGKTRQMAILGATAVTMMLAASGFGMGINSVGQKKVKKQKLCWISFFISAGVMCMSVIAFYLFFSRGESAGH